MSTTSFEFKQDYRFDQQVIMPERITAMLGAPGNILERQEFQRRHFRHGGLHSCPGCAGHELWQRGYKEEAAMLLVAAERDSLTEHGHSDKLEMVTKALWNAGLFSDGVFSPEIATTFRACARPSKVCPEGRIAGYSHKQGYGRNCDIYTSEHDQIINKICQNYQSHWNERHPGSKYALKVHKEQRIAASIGRRPDLLFETIDTETGKVIESHAIEVQKSPISMTEFQARFHDLSKASEDQSWIFKATRAQGSFNEVLRYCVETDIAAGLYEVKGQKGSNDNNIHLYLARDHYPDFANWPLKRHKSFGKGSDSCTNAEWKEEGELNAGKGQPRVSSGSRVKYEREEVSLLFTPKPSTASHSSRKPDTWAELTGQIIFIKHFPPKPGKQRMTSLRIKTTLPDSLLAKYPTINQRKDAIIKVITCIADNAEYIESNCSLWDIISVEGWIEIDTYKKKRKSDPDTLCLKCARDGIKVLYKQTRML